MNTGTIRVVVVDDHPVVRQGIIGVLADEPDFDVVGEAADGSAAESVTRATRPDVVLMDLRMPGVGGAAATRHIVEALPATRVLVLTSYESDDEILSAIEAGASGYLLKAAPAEEIFEAIRRVHAGEVALAPRVAARLVQQTRDAGRRADADGGGIRLSPRETEVLRLVAEGRSNAVIGRTLFIGEATVKTHLAHVFEKLGVRDRTRAVTRAMELGLI
ncbi:response regulator transcription factor [Pseudoclavibacter chungangensis]|uniref:Response regulator transcription factor n=1 Tax=Pseudoclavibacter chungangensis TaxID=587635 RepID=A0A7J5BQX5_9MICO|nr:response regulator transcription factor [Pseudoclavibacter chungangensis]KAB1656701.1 response regulator transcription factor [Pseudoclavibacter chungangensis]NYJ67845.1 DNA-binding NarL/FixJ family response regulator [Pseudoclavibacter chungangensis]